MPIARGRRTTSATKPRASQNAGRGNQRDARSSHSPSSRHPSRSENRVEHVVHAAIHTVEVSSIARGRRPGSRASVGDVHTSRNRSSGVEMNAETLADGIGCPSVGSGSWLSRRESPRARPQSRVRGRKTGHQSEPPRRRGRRRVHRRQAGEHRLTPDACEVRVVVVPTPRPVGEPDEVLVHARASRGEERVEVDAVRAVRLAWEQIRSTARASSRVASPFSGSTIRSTTNAR